MTSSNVVTMRLQPALEAETSAPQRLAALELHSRLSAGVPRVVAETMTAVDLPALRHYLAEAQAVTRPVSDRAAMVHLERLFLHYPQTPLSAEEQAERWGDWMADLADVPEDVLELACTRWRRSDARFAPSPGQLLAKVGGDQHLGRIRAIYARRAAEVLQLVQQEAA